MKYQENYHKFAWWLKNSGLSEVQAMNELQGAGIISDNCFFAQNVADFDCPAARDFLQANFCLRCKKENSACWCGK
jgi:hypothetical protein